ncbi:MAG: hypothetical protein CME91_06185 [Hyphomonadaceae bacterium]|nr:hypothetical protein [Hyphomonadaceae bacterium]MBA29041.1 hypothetical protein [Hyphomonadaceae bacterium]
MVNFFSPKVDQRHRGCLPVPPKRKYNNEGGPGIRECLCLLAGSDYPEEDRLAFVKAQITFWLIGAIDGHAKNFSLFLTPDGRYRMTPLTTSCHCNRTIQRSSSGGTNSGLQWLLETSEIMRWKAFCPFISWKMPRQPEWLRTR